MALLATERLDLDPWRPGDRTWFARLATTPEVVRYIADGALWDDARIDAFLERQRSGFDEHGTSTFPVTYRETGAKIGFCGAQVVSPPVEIDLGWWLFPAWWGRGLATEAARAVVARAFGELGLPFVRSIAQPGNAASIGIMRKLGMRCEGRRRHDGIEVVSYVLRAPGADVRR